MGLKVVMVTALRGLSLSQDFVYSTSVILQMAKSSPRGKRPYLPEISRPLGGKAGTRILWLLLSQATSIPFSW